MLLNKVHVDTKQKYKHTAFSDKLIINTCSSSAYNDGVIKRRTCIVRRDGIM